jgi:hypothetical protein
MIDHTGASQMCSDNHICITNYLLNSSSESAVCVKSETDSISVSYW